MIRAETGRAVVTVQANGVGDPADAAAKLAMLLEKECRARSSIAVADVANPLKTLEFL